MNHLRGKRVVGKPPKKIEHPQKEQLSQDDIFALEIAKRVSSIVGRDKAPQVTAQVVALISERFSGPIAHPRHLREYEDISPGAADRIIRMAEEALNHQKRMEEMSLVGDIQDVKDGRFYGFCALIILIFAALASGLYGQQALALAFLGTGVIGTIGAFINGKAERKT